MDVVTADAVDGLVAIAAACPKCEGRHIGLPVLRERQYAAPHA
jgi:hypothetical protein